MLLSARVQASFWTRWMPCWWSRLVFQLPRISGGRVGGGSSPVEYRDARELLALQEFQARAPAGRDVAELVVGEAELRTAAAESPPPTTVSAVDLASAPAPPRGCRRRRRGTRRRPSGRSRRRSGRRSSPRRRPPAAGPMSSPSLVTGSSRRDDRGRRRRPRTGRHDHVGGEHDLDAGIAARSR